MVVGGYPKQELRVSETSSTTLRMLPVIDFSHEVFRASPEREDGIKAAIRYLDSKGEDVIEYFKFFEYHGIKIY